MGCDRLKVAEGSVDLGERVGCVESSKNRVSR